jgi:hypothetical protein
MSTAGFFIAYRFHGNVVVDPELACRFHFVLQTAEPAIY